MNQPNGNGLAGPIILKPKAFDGCLLGLRFATPEDAPALALLDQDCFVIPWSEASYQNDLLNPDRTCYLVWSILEMENRFMQSAATGNPIVGYGGFWQIDGEAEIMNIAVHASWRRRGLAADLLEELIKQARKRRLRQISLEVRADNLPAQALYHSFGFESAGRRPKYYADNGEDAIIMLKNIH